MHSPVRPARTGKGNSHRRWFTGGFYVNCAAQAAPRYLMLDSIEFVCISKSLLLFIG
jgi:hypothetical protein